MYCLRGALAKYAGRRGSPRSKIAAAGTVAGQVENVTGKAHKQSFEVSCTIPELETATTGRGSTRRDAEQEAALAMLDAVDKIE